MRSKPNLLKNVIFCIGDGMGFEKVKAAGMYAHGAAGTLSFEAFPYQGEVTTHSADSSMTDSAAAATALATGFKVNNGVLSTALPGDGRELYTLLEHFRDQDKSTGLVSTTFITHATPAAFGAHNPSRGNLEEIAGDYLNYTRPNVLLGGGGNGMSAATAEAADYTVITDQQGLLTLDTKNLSRVSGQFGDTNLPYEYDGLGDLPHLSEMAATALDILARNPIGFFLMIEGGRIDHAGHSNDIERNVCETIEFSKTLRVVMDWSQGRNDTLIIVTADHETGGLQVLENNGAGNFPTVSWTTEGHTSTNVPVYGWGPNAERIGGLMDNTDLFDVVNNGVGRVKPVVGADVVAREICLD
ncbi:MAG: alkaline phosphatase [Candidatus Poribacteria bacterium]|nr:alkaline phosphatase [Candidatus Poribacteria bacterium]